MWKDCIDPNPFQCLMGLTDSCAKALKEWDEKENGVIPEKVKDLRDRLRFLESLP